MPKVWHTIYLAVIVGLLAVILWLMNVEPDLSRDEPVRPVVSPLAILPFGVSGTDRSLGSVAQTVTQEIARSLSRYDNLEILPGGDVKRFSGTAVSIQEIGWDLGVRTVLEGAVRKFGNKVRVTAQLIDAESGYHLWSDSFDASEEEISDVAAQIATEIYSLSKR